MTVDLSKLNFYSGANYLKRSSLSDTASLTLPAFGSSVTTTVDHNLNYIPFFDVFADIDGDGIIWSGGDKVTKYTESSLGTNPESPRLSVWTTTTTLTITLTNNTSPTATGTRSVYWIIYLDYGDR